MNQLGAGKIRDFLQKIKIKAQAELERHVDDIESPRGNYTIDTYGISPPESPRRALFHPAPPLDKRIIDTRNMEGGSHEWREKVNKRKKLFGL